MFVVQTCFQHAFYFTIGTPSPTKYPCPPGTFTNRSDLYMESQCTDCYQQWYCPGGEAAPRDRCPPGYYCPIKTRFATEYPCPNRTYNPDYGLFNASQCKVCTQGHFCEKGTVSPYECPIGMWLLYIFLALLALQEFVLLISLRQFHDHGWKWLGATCAVRTARFWISWQFNN